MFPSACEIVRFGALVLLAFAALRPRLVAMSTPRLLAIGDGLEKMALVNLVVIEQIARSYKTTIFTKANIMIAISSSKKKQRSSY